MKKLKFLGLLSLFCLLLPACKDDEMSEEEMRTKLFSDRNDWRYDRLQGKVKSMTASYYKDCEWQNNSIIEGNIYSRSIYEYNEAGFYSKITDSYSDETIIRTFFYDNKHRISEMYFEGHPDIEKSIYDYDDNNKTVTVTDYNNNGEITGYIVYNLNKNGRIDFNNSEYYRPKRSNILDGDFDMKSENQYDENGNCILSYRVIKHITYGYVISSYAKMDYKYY